MPHLKAVYSKGTFVSTDVPTRTSTAGAKQGTTSFSSNNFIKGCPFGGSGGKPPVYRKKRK